MSQDKDQQIALLVNQGLDGDMDAVNSCEDKIVRAKAKAMIMKVKKGTVDRPPMPKISSTGASKSSGDITKNNTKVTESINEKVKKLLEKKFPDSLDDNYARFDVMYNHLSDSISAKVLPSSDITLPPISFLDPPYGEVHEITEMFSVVAGGGSKAEDWTLYNIHDGLPGNEVTAISRDNSGKMLLGTQSSPLIA